MMKTEEDYKLEKIIFKYKSALKVLQTKLDIINEEIENSSRCNPIEHIKYRIKAKDSIYQKLISHGYEISLENIENNIHDVAGVRIVCSFLSDIKQIENIIKSDEDIIIKNREDYITNPKPSGYRSLHLNVLIPIQQVNQKEYVEVEIQIRTIAMDMWASLEHKICYKQDKILPKLIEGIKNLANTSKRIDELMEQMTKQSNNSEEFILPKVRDEKGLTEITKTSMLKYQSAQKIVVDKIKLLKSILQENEKQNPIEHIKTRIKSPISICQKLERNNYKVSAENMELHIHDIAGVRIVCSFLSDLEKIKNILISDRELTNKRIKDYVNYPKPNGYRSYHIITEVPVKMLDKTEYVEVEIQIRTIAMDMWASLEHKLCYRKEGTEPENIKNNLQLLSKISTEVDNRLNEIIITNISNKDIINPKTKRKKLNQGNI